MRSDQIGELAKALTKVQKILRGAPKDSSNPFFKSKYADLESVWDTIREPLTTNGLSITQMPISDREEIGVETILMHESGQFIANSITMKPIDNKPQTAVALITYLRRAGVSGAIGVVQTDDDGNESSGRTASLTATNINHPNNKHITNTVVAEIKESLDSTKPYLPPFGKYKGVKLTDIGLKDLELHRAEIADSIAAKKVTGSNLKLAEQLLSEIDKVLS